jgi:O-antigen/teichoic acid export membrane protein
VANAVEVTASSKSIAGEAVASTEPIPNRASAASSATERAAGEETDAAWLAKGSSVVLAGAFVGQALQFGCQVALARLLGPAEFGLYGIGWTLFRLVGPFASLGLNSGVIYGASVAAPSDTGRRRDVLIQSLVLGVLAGGVIGVAGYIGAPWLCVSVFGKAKLTAVIRVFALALPLMTGLAVAAASTKLTLSMAYSTITEMFTQPGLNLLFVIVALHFFHWRLMGAIQAAVFSYALALVLALFFVLILFWPILRSRGKMRFYVGELLAFSLPASIAGAFVNLINRVDRLVIGAFLSVTEVGIYQAASQASALFDTVPNIFNNVIAARVADIYSRGERNRLEELYRLGAKWSFYLTTPLFLLVCAAPAAVLDVLYGVHYRAGAWPLLILCLGLMSDAVIGAASPILIFSGNQKLAGSISTSALISAIALNYMLVPRLGMLGGAISTALAEGGMLCSLLLAVKLRLGIWPYDRRWLKGIAAAACAAAALGLLHTWLGASAQLALIPNILIAGGVFWVVLLLFGLDPEDKRFIWRERSCNKGRSRGS